jgi:trans-AT polyketide synthase/acyltransferase/oxidoreductase domain-containing protein
MSAAAREFAGFLDGFPLAEPAFPVYANRTAQPYTHADLPCLLTEQIDHPLLWHRTVRTLLAADPDTEFVEIGGGTVLTRMIRALRRERPLR